MVRKVQEKNYIARGGAFSVFLLIYVLLPIAASVYFSRTWGQLGNGIFYSVYSFYIGLFIISGISVPAISGRLIKSRIMRNAIKDARSMQRRAFLYCLITGALFSLSMYFFADYIGINIIKEPLSSLPVMVMAIALALGTLCSFLRGYFIGHGALVLLGSSMLVEQIVSVSGGIVTSRVFSDYGSKVAAVLRSPDHEILFKVSGYCMGIALGYAVSFLFLFIVYIATHGYFRRAYGKDAGRLREDSLVGRFSFLSSLFPFLLIILMTYGGIFFEHFIYKFLSPLYQDSGSLREGLYSFGTYAGGYRVLLSIPLFIALAMCRYPAGIMAKQPLSQDGKRRRALTSSSLKAVILTIVPISVTIGFGSEILVPLLYSDGVGEGLTTLLKIGMSGCILYAAALLLFTLLWEDGRKVSVLMGVSIPFIIKTLVEVLFIKTLKHDILSFAVSDIIFSVLLLIFAALLSFGAGILKRGIMREYVSVIIGTVISALLTTLLAFLLKKTAQATLGAGIIIFIVTGIIAYASFYSLVIILRGAVRKDIAALPGSGPILFFGRLTGLL